MAILHSNGTLIVDSIPTHTPTGIQATLARLQNTMKYWYWNGTIWTELDITIPTSFTGGILSDNATSLATLLQELETAIEAVTQDGSHANISRAGAIEDVAPTSAEWTAAGNDGTAGNRDSADVYLQGAEILEKWIYTGGAWSKAISLNLSQTAANLGYTPSPTNGIVTNTTGTDATIPVVDATNAGLMIPADKTKVDFVSVTQPVDLDEVEAEAANLVVLSGVASDAQNLGTFTGDTIPDNSTIKAAFQALETAVETEPPGYLSKAAATTALGTGKEFQYLAANLDGAVEGVTAWT